MRQEQVSNKLRKYKWVVPGSGRRKHLQKDYTVQEASIAMLLFCNLYFTYVFL